jgi:hypothetical protein
MKKIFIVFFLTGLSCLQVTACDICGCGTSNLNPFLFPYLSKSYVGLSYMYRSYHIHQADGMKSTELYNTVSLTGQYSIGKRLKLSAMLPYLQSSLATENSTRKLSGLGDASILLNYKILDNQKGSFRHLVILGAGIKLATGKYISSSSGKTDEQNFQLGTGSFDYLLSGAYRVSHNKWAFSSMVSYKYTTQNKDDYRFGDVLTGNVMAVYSMAPGKFSISPYVQFIGEKQMQNADKHMLQEGSDGNILYAGGGVDIAVKRFSFGINYQGALKQHLSEGLIKAKPRFTTQISFTF